MEDRICGNCGYPVEAQWDKCPECGSDRARQKVILSRRQRALQIRWLVPAIAGLALAPGLLVLPMELLGVPGGEVILWLLLLLAIPVSAVLWGGLLDAIEPGRNWVGLLLLGIVLGVSTQFAGLLLMAVAMLTFG